MASLLQKPANGTTPARARQPNRNVQCVRGMSRRRPPKCRMSITPPMACITLPAPRNSSALKKACVNRWNMPAVMPAERAGAQAEEHVAELADRRIGQHALQVVLRQRDQAGQQRREAADAPRPTSCASGEAMNSGVQRATM